MSTDRELLEDAAKAAGMRVGFEPDGKERGRYDLYWSNIHHKLVWHGKSAGSEYPRPIFWNPLADDGDALRLADAMSLSFPGNLGIDKAAAELRRLSAENERLAAEVANRNRRALAGDEAVAALANVHAHYEGLEAQRDALLEALKVIVSIDGHSALTEAEADEIHARARAAIRAVEDAK